MFIHHDDFCVFDRCSISLDVMRGMNVSRETATY